MQTVALVPAFRNESTIAATVRALREDHRVSEVIVVDDASDDATAQRAAGAGARVLRLARNVGKGGAIEAALSEAGPAGIYLMVDGDTGASASSVVDLADPIRRGEADMVIGVLPSPGARGGFGAVRQTAAVLIRLASGYRTRAPLSGQRAVAGAVFRACRPLAAGFGIDSALTADAASQGFRIREVEVDMTHDHRGRSLPGFAHRARQGRAVFGAMLPRVVRAVARRQR